MKHFFIFLLTLFICQISFAQGLKIKKFTTSVSDLSASIQPREDANGVSCGLVKVQTKTQGVTFDGAVVGEVANQMNEYWVYLPKGTQEFTIARPNYLPMTVRLADYGIDAIEAKTTYTMVLKEENLKEEKCGVVMHIKPYDAVVKVDGVTLKTTADGNYHVNLPKGEHVCNFSAMGYNSASKMVTTGKGVEELSVELESILAEINIVSETSTAEILIDSVSKGIGRWTGKLMPGKHSIEVRQEGYTPTTKSMIFYQKEKRSVTIPKLKAITGILNVTTIPLGCKVFIDGEDVGRTPCLINDVVYGRHLLNLELDSCGLKRQKEIEVFVKDKAEQRISYELVQQEKMDHYAQAYEWFVKGCIEDLCPTCYYPNEITTLLYNAIIENINYLDKDFFRQNVFIPIYNIAYLYPSDYSGVCIGEKMIEHYTEYVGLDDIIESIKHNKYEPFCHPGRFNAAYFPTPQKAELICSFLEKNIIDENFYGNKIADCNETIRKNKNTINKLIGQFSKTFDKRYHYDEKYISELEDIIYWCITLNYKKQADEFEHQYKQIIKQFKFKLSHDDEWFFGSNIGNSSYFCKLRAIYYEIKKDYKEAIFWFQKAVEYMIQYADYFGQNYNQYPIEELNNKIKELKSKL